jgi:hypothetical protein
MPAREMERTNIPAEVVQIYVFYPISSPLIERRTGLITPPTSLFGVVTPRYETSLHSYIIKLTWPEEVGLNETDISFPPDLLSHFHNRHSSSSSPFMYHFVLMRCTSEHTFYERLITSKHPCASFPQLIRISDWNYH